MLKRILGLCGVLIFGVSAFFCTGCQGEPSATSKPEVITELNQPFENSVIRVTVTDLRAESLEDDEIGIYADFVVKNISAGSVTLSRFCIRTYADDVIVDKTNRALNPRAGQAVGVHPIRLYPQGLVKN